MDFLSNVLKGVLIGVGSIAPGVSGGALAMILGLYEKLVYAVGNFFKDIKKNIIFLFPIGLGGGIGVIAFSKILKFLLANYTMPTTYTFAGLIVGTLPVLFKRANKKGFKKSYLIFLVAALALAVSFAFIESGFSADQAAAQIELTGGNIVKLILIGFLIAGSLVIPGISGSVLLMLIGVYTLFLDAVASINVFVLAPIAIGLGIGVLAFSKLMEYMLDRHYGITYYAVIGFLIGSIPEVITGFPSGSTGVLSILLFIVGVITSYYFSKLEKE